MFSLFPFDYHDFSLQKHKHLIVNSMIVFKAPCICIHYEEFLFAALVAPVSKTSATSQNPRFEKFGLFTTVWCTIATSQNPQFEKFGLFATVWCTVATSLFSHRWKFRLFAVPSWEPRTTTADISIQKIPLNHG